MLLKLKRTPGAKVKPIKYINTGYSVPAIGSTVTAIGFGTTSESGDISAVLKQVDIKVVGGRTCYAEYAGRAKVSDVVMICAAASGKDSCQGDSGGPLLLNADTLVGHVSWGIGCAHAGSPGVYTRISAFSKFLSTSVCSLSDYKPASCTTATAPSSKTLTAPPCPTTDRCWYSKSELGYYMHLMTVSQCVDLCVGRSYNDWLNLNFVCGECPS